MFAMLVFGYAHHSVSFVSQLQITLTVAVINMVHLLPLVKDLARLFCLGLMELTTHGVHLIGGELLARRHIVIQRQFGT